MAGEWPAHGLIAGGKYRRFVEKLSDQLLQVGGALTWANVISTLSTRRKYPNYKDQPRSIHWRRATIH